MAQAHYNISAKNGNRDGMAGFVRVTSKVETSSLDDFEIALDYAKQLSTNEAKEVIPLLEKKLAEKKKGFIPIELNEENVQLIFNRCIANKECKNVTVSSLFFSSLGYEKEDDGLLFDKRQISLNRRNIEYLYGQLKAIHTKQHILKLEDLVQTYADINWVRDNAYLMQLLYLGASDELTILHPFIAKYNGTYLNIPIKATLSPQDSNFPAWWKIHKSEWENNPINV